nr:hypothetical protein [Pandoravirus massiliensis]
MRPTRQRRGKHTARSIPQLDTTPGDADELPNSESRLPCTRPRHSLPAEIWTLIAHYCAASDLPNLSATCTMLYDVARRRAHQDALATYASVDIFVSHWQKATAFCDRHLYRARCDQCSWGTSPPHAVMCTHVGRDH